MPKYHDLSGQKFNYLTVLSLHHKKQLFNKEGKPNGHLYYYECVCDCGKKTIVAASALKRSSVKSCGCYQRKMASEAAKISSRKHGYRNTRLYREWQSMKGRCYYPSVNGYERYGGRGIIVCSEWKNNFVAFKDWAELHGYKDSLTIDRIDVNGNYEPSNCRWVTKEIQNKNTRRNINITYKGETHNVREWSSILNININTLYDRLRRGWSGEKTLSTPVKTTSTSTI